MWRYTQVSITKGDYKSGVYQYAGGKGATIKVWGKLEKEFIGLELLGDRLSWLKFKGFPIKLKSTIQAPGILLWLYLYSVYF